MITTMSDCNSFLSLKGFTLGDLASYLECH